jgi:hypothetical protein
MENEVNWIETKSLEGASNFDLYISALYFSITTITTVGYGDIAGFSTNERIFCILLMIGGVI